MSLEDRAEELSSDLGVDKQEVKEDLENLVSYSVPMDEAVQSLRRKYGDGSSGGGSSGPTAMDVADVTTESGSVTLTGRVLVVGRRSIQYQGDTQTIYEGEFADETGTIDFTAWNDFGLETGQTLQVGNAGVREWEGEPELNLGESTSVSVLDDALEVPYDVGGDRTVRELSPGDRGRNVEVTIEEVERRTIDGRDGETDILSGVLADETGRLPFTDWTANAAIEAGGNVRIENGYVREYRGVPELNVSEFSTVTELDREIEVGDAVAADSIFDAVTGGGVYDVEVSGNVIEVRDGSGLIQRCPECNRVVQNGQCRSHGEVDAEDDMRVKAILDDGTATTTVVLDRDLSERVYGGTLEDAKEQAREAMDQEVVADDIREEIVGPEFRVRGHLSVDEYGGNLDASTFERVEDDPAERARAFLEEVRA
ncbi:Single-stranded DNA binding protein [Halorubellus sp. JP-L1]|uniref:Single-stranded DNA binding protein n=1 Tax=Halorubellus sp. JP-L1 TaxID=2715753 RepID=UPI0014087785|nr:Single-stranded DNA binding protein [Halorubellus sp. JP-L1]NHN40881.1 Single-stranded DNA binding protein [Halorubellus sp. JP-L1]